MPKVSKGKYKAWSITLRPAGGITMEDINRTKLRILKMRNIIGYKIVTEKEHDERHIHLAIFYRREQDASDVRKVWARLFREDWDSRHHYGNSQFRVSCDCNSMYNDDWVTRYMDKDDDTVVILDKLPDAETRLASYKDREGVTKQSKAGGNKYLGDKFFLHKEALWFEFMGPQYPQTIGQVSDFLARMMYKERKMNCITSLRRIREVTHTLFSFLKKSEIVNYYDKRLFNGIIPLYDL